MMIRIDVNVNYGAVMPLSKAIVLTAYICDLTLFVSNGMDTSSPTNNAIF